MMQANDVRAIGAKVRTNGRGREFASFNGYAFGVARFSEHPLWERHPASDEFLQVFDGALDITVLAEDGPVEATLLPGSVFVVPKGLWHSPRPRGLVTLMFASDPTGSEVSNRKDPRVSAKRTSRQ